MCAPDYYDVTYETNPWMSVARAPFKKRAVTMNRKIEKFLQRINGLMCSECMLSLIW